MRRNKLLAGIGSAVLLLAGASWFVWPRSKARSSASQQSATEIQNQTAQQLDQIVATYRKIIVLMEDAGALDEVNRERVTTVGRVLFQQNQEHLSALGARLSDELAKSAFPAVEAFLERLENSREYHDALIANNAGFALYKSGELEDAVRWFEKAIQLDPHRAVAYLNLGDADVKLKRDAQAKQAYEKFLELAPASKSAPEVREKLKALEP